MDVEKRWEEANQHLAAFLGDPDRVYDAAKMVLGVVTGLSVAGVSFGLAMVAVYRGSTVSVFGALALFWSGYLFAHYAATGKVIHQRGEGKVLPKSRFRAVAAVVGVLLLLAGLTGLPFPAVRGDMAGASLTGLTAAFGFLIAHYGFTGDLL